MFEDLFSLEAQNDEIDIDVSDSVTINDETAVDEAGSDSEVVDVSNISEKTAAHNEAASAGGVATGSNEEQISMDPVAASESYIFHQFGLSREDLAEAVQDTVEEAAALPTNDEPSEDPDLVDTAVVESETSGGEVVNPDEIPEDTPADNAGQTPEVEDLDESTSEEDGESAQDSDEESDTSVESLLMSSLGFSTTKVAESSEKFNGYFKAKEFYVNGDKKTTTRFSDGKEFLTSKLGRSKIDLLKADIKKKGLELATIKDCNTLPPTFFQNLVRTYQTPGTHFSKNYVKYYNLSGIVFAVVPYTEYSTMIYAMCKKNGKKITSVLYANINANGIKAENIK